MSCSPTGYMLRGWFYFGRLVSTTSPNASIHLYSDSDLIIVPEKISGSTCCCVLFLFLRVTSHQFENITMLNRNHPEHDTPLKDQRNKGDKKDWIETLHRYVSRVWWRERDRRRWHHVLWGFTLCMECVQVSARHRMKHLQSRNHLIFVSIVHLLINLKRRQGVKETKVASLTSEPNSVKLQMQGNSKNSTPPTIFQKKYSFLQPQTTSALVPSDQTFTKTWSCMISTQLSLAPFLKREERKIPPKSDCASIHRGHQRISPIQKDSRHWWILKSFKLTTQSMFESSYSCNTLVITYMWPGLTKRVLSPMTGSPIFSHKCKATWMHY